LHSPSSNHDNAAAFHQIIATISSASLGLHLSGERGLGKETIIRLLYADSPYRGYPFIKVNCPALSGTDAAGDKPCFGEADARTANGRFSLFRLFHQGVLYLHAVDELARDLQERLLGLIRRKVVASGFPAGASRRGILILSTAPRPLEACVAAGRFDATLCELLSGLSIHIPPLRHSPERIVPLVNYYLDSGLLGERCGGRSRPTRAQLARLRAYPWPGNVKELVGVVRHALHTGDWDAALRLLGPNKGSGGDYASVNLTPEGVSLMPDFEITQGRLLESLSATQPFEEMGLMDWLIYEEVLTNNKLH